MVEHSKLLLLQQMMQIFSKTTRSVALWGLLAIASPVVLGTTPIFAQSATAQMQPAEMETEDWETFVSETGGFSAAFPGTPTETIEEATSMDEDPDKEIWDTGESGKVTFEPEDLDSGYFVAYQHFPIIEDTRVFMPEAEITAGILTSARNSVVQDNEVLSERDIELDGYQGKELELQTPEGYQKIRVYWVNSDLYLYFVMGGASTPEDAIAGEIDRFLDSFTLLE